eukprot:10573957-Alexandrium_andersonii.AAC.1
MRYLAWSFTAAASGTYPDRDHRGRPWPPGSFRSELQGRRLRHKMAVTEVKADWAEMAHTFALPSWSTRLYPCAFCHTDKEHWCGQQLEATTSEAFPWAVALSLIHI